MVVCTLRPSLQLYKLRARTGAETILYTTRGTTDIPLYGISFATQGVENFMGTVMNVENQDLISKMEGYAVQGVHGKRCRSHILTEMYLASGTASNYRQCVRHICSQIRSIITKGLRMFIFLKLQIQGLI